VIITRALRLTAGACMLALLAPAELPAQQRSGGTVVGTVRSAVTGEPLTAVTVRVEGTETGTLSDGQGRYILAGVPPGPQTLRAERLGFAAARVPLTVPAGGSVRQDILLAQSALQVEGITVTADAAGRAQGELGTASVVGREAIAAQTATTLAGILELIPGVSLSAPGLAGVQQIALRAAPTGSASTTQLASFGTLIVVDGVPLSNNANLQTFGPRGTVGFPTSADGGLDLRRIAASSIERVEVLRGIPSARYGDLTQGAILVETRTGAVEPEVSLQFDEQTLTVSSVAGREWRGQGVAGGFDLARYHLAPGQTPDIANRLSGQLAHRAAFGPAGRLTLDTRLALHHLLEDQPERPDVQPGLKRERSDQGLRLSERASLRLGGNARMQMTASFEAGRQRGFLQHRVSSGVLPFTERTDEGRSIGYHIGGVYLTQLRLEGEPRNLYGRLEVEAPFEFLRAEHDFRSGLELRREWNAGAGYQFDVSRPPQVSAGGIRGYDRPRRFDAVPALPISAIYLDDRMRWMLPGDMPLVVQGGLRGEVLHEPGSWFTERRDVSLQPRFNAELSPRGWLRLRGGWGRTAKVPSLNRLAPAPEYYDLVNVNWYTDDPAERLAVLTTFIRSSHNPELGFARGEKAEAGVEMGFGRSAFSLVAFDETVRGAVGVSPQPGWLPLHRYELSDSTIGTGRRPDIIDPPAGTDTVPILVGVPVNNTRIHSRGLEATATFPEVPFLRLRVQAQGAWISTTQSADALDFGSVTRYSEFQRTPSIRRIPVWEDRVFEGARALATYRIIHHQPAAGLVITATIQHNFLDENRDVLGTDSLAYVGYLTRDGEVVRVPAERRGDPEFADLRFPRTGFFQDASAPPTWMMNLQVSKTLPMNGRLSFWAFNAMDRRGMFPEQNVRARLYPARRFGIEVVISPSAMLREAR
jgi:outer membrane receptor protein involved in Fe transport